MSDPVQALIVDLLEWIGPGTRPYSEVMEAWRTSCPRLPVWEEANARGFIRSVHEVGQPPQVEKIRPHPHSGSRGNGAASKTGGKAAYSGIDAAGTRRSASLGARDHFEVPARHGSVRGLPPWLLGIWA